MNASELIEVLQQLPADSIVYVEFIGGKYAAQVVAGHRISGDMFPHIILQVNAP